MNRRVLFLLACCMLLTAALALGPAGCADDDDDDAGDDIGDDDAADDDDDTGDDDDFEDLREPADYVNPFVGTGGVGFGVGSTLPGPYLPFGMVRLSPDTSMGGFVFGAQHCGGYWYEDYDIRGFSHTHLSGTGAPDQGNILFMPVLGISDRKVVEKGYRSGFRHETEAAWPGYYSVMLDDTGIRAELTATERCGMHRYTFPATLEAVILINVSHAIETGSCSDAHVQVHPDRRAVEGWMVNNGSLSGRYGGLKVYFSAEFDRPFIQYGVWDQGEVRKKETERDGDDIGAYVGFLAGEGEEIVAKVGISYISVQQARAHLEDEIPGWDFDEVWWAAREAWARELDVIRVEGGTPDERVIFYSAMYHVLTMPTNFTEAGGLYMGFDKQPHVAEGFTYYTDFSMWDTFRTLHPLLALIAPDRARDMMVSLVKMYEQGGAIPKWPMGVGYTGCMIGTSGDVVIADTYLKGVTDFDIETAYEGLRAHATGPVPHAGRGGLEQYIELGYCPINYVGDPVSVTLEYVFDDWCLARLAEALGKQEDQEEFDRRAQFYRNLYDQESGFMRGRYDDGSWFSPFIPAWFSYEYCEGNAWHWTWFVPHDAEGLIELMGGPAPFVEKLDFFFTKASQEPDTLFMDVHYWHGNEPDIHAAYMFNEAGRPDLTQKWVRWVAETKYTTGPDGYDGNDDCGTLSAWYVFSALGFYPLPCGNLYFVGSPIFTRAVVRAPGGDIVVEAPNASAENIYVQSVTIDGEPLDVPWFTHDRIANGATLHFEMGDAPSDWGMGGK